MTLAGYQQIVRGGLFRGEFSKSFEKLEPFMVGRVEAVNFTMPQVNHVFRRGHRVMVQVRSRWFPLVDRNPQTPVNIQTAGPEDVKVETQRAVRSQTPPSGMEVYVLAAPLPCRWPDPGAGRLRAGRSHWTR